MNEWKKASLDDRLSGFASKVPAVIIRVKVSAGLGLDGCLNIKMCVSSSIR